MATETHPFTHLDTPTSASNDAVLPPRARGRHAAADTSSTALSLLRELLNQLAILLRQELALAGAELKRSLTSLKAGVASLAAAGAILFSGFLVLLAAAVLGLSNVLAPWLSALIVGAGVVGLGVVLLLVARRQLHPDAVAPQRSTESLKRDRDMVARHLS